MKAKYKGAIKLFFTIALILLSCSMLFACAKDDIHNLKPIYQAIQLPLNGNIYIDDYITYDGKGKLTYSVENTDVLLLKDGKVTGIATGNGKIVVSTKDETISIPVYVVNPGETSIEAIDNETVYDGDTKNINIRAPSLPEGSILKYYQNGEEFLGTTEPGIYEITVEAFLPDGFSAYYLQQTATLTIDRATVSMSQIRFRNASYDYDGTEKELLIEGELPSYVTVSYSNNKHSDVGKYNATVNFAVDTKYYYEIMPLNAQLTINSISIDSAKLGFLNKTVVYNGNYQYISYNNLPQGFTVEYYLNTVSEGNKITDITAWFKNVGTYIIIAKLSADEIYTKNYQFTPNVTATLEIRKADFINNLLWNDVPTAYQYSGEGVTVGENGSVCLTGDTPFGVNGEFTDGTSFTYFYLIDDKKVAITEENSTQTDVGIYKVIASFNMPIGVDTNYNKLADMEFSFTINKANYNMDNVVFEGETFTYDGDIRTYLVSYPTQFGIDVKIDYYLSEDNGLTFAKVETPSAQNVGTYLMRASFTYNTTVLLNNYLPIAAKTITVNVERLAVDLGDITFENATYDYQGVERSLQVGGTIPSNVNVSYSENNLQTDADIYYITATFAYKIGENEVATNNYYFIQNSVKVSNTKIAILTIKKASYDEAEIIPLYHVNGDIYSPNKKLLDYAILNEENEQTQEISWAYPETIPTVNNSGYTAYYNRDIKNYNNCIVNISIDIQQAQIDGNDISIASQFLPRTGSPVKPDYLINGQKDENNVLKVIMPSLIEWGEYSISVSFELADKINYKFINVPEPIDINLFIYNGSLFNYKDSVTQINGTQLIKYFGGAFTTLSVPNGTTSIRKEAIADADSLTEIILPDTLNKTNVARGAIKLTANSMLSRITIPFVGVNGFDDFGSLFELNNADLPSTLEYVTVSAEYNIPDNAFKGCENIRQINYTFDVLGVGNDAFNGCKKLTTIRIGTSMTSIGQYAFRNCFNLINLSVPFIGSDITDTLSTISYLLGENIDENEYRNYLLATLNITGNVVSLPDSAFANLSNVGTINLPSTLQSIGKEAFSMVKAKLNINDDIEIITEKMFYNYRGTSLTLPSGVTSIGAYAFSGASLLASLTLPNTVTSIGKNAFQKVKCIVSFEQGATISVIGESAFYEYEGGGFIIPATVTELGKNSFQKSGFTSIIIPSSVTTLGEGVFQECPNLTNVTLYNTLVGTKMFYNCQSLTTINFENVQTISSSAFEKCQNLQSVLLKENVQEIGEFAFYDCTSMNSCEIMANEVIVLHDNSFRTGESFIIRVHNPDEYKTAYPNLSDRFMVWGS